MTDQNNRLSDIKFSKMSFPNILEYNFQKQIIVPEKNSSVFFLNSLLVFFLFVAKIGQFLSDGCSAPCVSEGALE